MGNARNIPPTGIRFPNWLKEALKSSANKECRSLNGEVIKRLEKSLKEEGLLSGQ
ncbi:Arc family DNA-binding protein [Yersinia enterocolitica]|uniref:Arc family DNA-binding protein n=1 Tax=Yersinia intermedia TaxID=631 RepID=UPI0022FE595D|nr:Arc family DNA-binding protein [Yersinia intermedia]ELI7915925.1 Arc family DNA-binding protein [Yersinia enterocolitica]ELI7925519.1 Arc family DNA-binding protein [Yersinia enterocolitica]ELI7957706.1 Arc family DNA-binding protein [Yersinia enterocolitica]ELI8143095.1 Arc family DNA-binding protein [Yersinia enterocolitica]ELI8184219.1 Arc family DNA-binding protein [Yersinia enterocolitica]